MKKRTGLGAWFTPQLLAFHAFALLAMIVCVFMGLWQLGVYDQRQANERAEQNDVPRVELSEIWSADEPFTTRQNMRPVTITGEFLPTDQQFWAIGKDDENRSGYRLVAPVRVEDRLLLVVRGWVTEREVLPEVPLGETTFDAALMPSEDAISGWDEDSRTVGSVRVPTMLNVFDGEFWSGIALSQDEQISTGMERLELPKKSPSWTAGGRNLGYGLQWWAFVVFIAFMWWKMASEMVRSDGDNLNS